MTRLSRTGAVLALLANCLFTVLPGTADQGSGQVIEELLDLPLEELLQVKISTAAKYEQLTADAPASVTIVTAEDIQLYGYRTLAEVLRHSAGFYLSNDRNYTYLGVRGFGRPSDYNNRILLMQDGHLLNESIFGQALLANGMPLDMYSIEQIEIVRGPGSALYGSYAMLAVVNVVTRKGGARPAAHLAVEGGSWGRRQVSASYSRQLAEELGLHLSGRWGDAEGQDYFYAEYAHPDSASGHSRHSDGERYRSLSARLDYRHLSVQGLYTWRHKTIPTGAYDTLIDDPRTWTRDSHSYIEARLDQPLGEYRRLVLRAYLDDAPYQGSYLYPDFLQLDETQNRALGSEVQFHAALPRANRLVVGGEFRRDFRASYYEYTASGVDFDRNYPFHQYSFYLQDRWELTPALSAVLGLRHDRPSSAGSTTTPRAALVYHPLPRTALKLLYGEAFRTPGVWESKVEDENLGFLANPALGPEQIRTAELVWEQGLGRRLFQTISLYEYRMDHLIDQVQVGEELYQYQNTSGARARGVEMQLETRRQGGVQGYARYALQRAETAETGRRLTNSPAHQLRLGGGSPLGDYLRASVQILAESQRLTLHSNHTAAFWKADINAALSPPRTWLPAGARARLVLLIHNLFDADHAVPGGLEHRQATIAQDGRNLALRLECGW